MYYYIFDPPQGPKEFERTAQIKEFVSSLGIAGEMVAPQPGRTIENLVEMAVQKRYSTIIAVGGITLINRVARALEPHDVVFGIIPLSENPDISRIIGCSDWKSAAEHLKRRRFQPMRLGTFNEQGCFLTPATIQFAPGEGYWLENKQYTVHGMGPGVLTITPIEAEDEEGEGYLEVVFGEPAIQKRGLFSRLLGGSQAVQTPTKLPLLRFSLKTDTPHSVSVAGIEVATTPLTCSLQKKPIKLIVGKGKE